MTASQLSETELKQKQYYNAIASTYDQHYASAHAIQYRAEVFDRFLRDVPLDWPRLDVLDAMCGGGENAAYFARRGCRVSGVDISDAQCRFFAKRFPQSEIQCGSIFHTAFAADRFDFVVTESLHHLHPQVEVGLREIARVLKPGGYFMAWEPVSGSALDLARKLWYRLDRRYFEDNEQSIDLDRVQVALGAEFESIKTRFGGNLAHLFVMSSMHFRIPLWLVDRYAPALLWAEKWIEKAQTRPSACWGLALYRKRAI